MRRRSLVAVLIVIVIVGTPLAAGFGTAGTASAIGLPGVRGLITSDGLFFVQVGFAQFGFAQFIGNGSQLYASSVLLNVTGLTTSLQVAHISLYS